MYSVNFVWDGYFELVPLVDEGALNSARAGTVPLKFSLGGYYGLDILQTGYPQSVRVDCNTYEPIGEPQPTDSKRGLRSIGNRYHYNWNTDKSWNGTCRQLIIELKDNSVDTALFVFE